MEESGGRRQPRHGAPAAVWNAPGHSLVLGSALGAEEHSTGVAHAKQFAGGRTQKMLMILHQRDGAQFAAFGSVTGLIRERPDFGIRDIPIGDVGNSWCIPGEPEPKKQSNLPVDMGLAANL